MHVKEETVSIELKEITLSSLEVLLVAPLRLKNRLETTVALTTAQTKK